MLVKEQTWLTMQRHARFVDFNPDSGVLTFLASQSSDKGKEELSDEPKEQLPIILDKQTPVEATLKTDDSKKQRFVKVWGGGKAEELKKRLQSLDSTPTWKKFATKAAATRMADALTTWLKEEWYPKNPKTNPGLADVQQGVPFSEWARVLWKETQGESRVPVKRVQKKKQKTAVKLTELYFATLQYDKVGLASQIEESLGRINVPYENAYQLVEQFEKWLLETWYPDKLQNPVDPTVEDVLNALPNFAQYATLDQWKRIFEFKKATTLTKNYIEMWGGGKKILEKRMKDHMGVTKQEADLLISELSNWLLKEWYPFHSEKDPSIEEVFRHVSRFKKYGTLESLKLILIYKDPKEGKESHEGAVPVMGSYDLNLALRFSKARNMIISEFTIREKTWDGKQPIAFLTNLDAGGEDKVSKILRNEALRYLNVDKNAVRIIVPPVFDKANLHSILLLNQSGRTGIDLVHFHAIDTTNTWETLTFNPLIYTDIETGDLKELSVFSDISRMQGETFTFESTFITDAGNRKKTQGTIHVVKFIPATQDFHVAFALYSGRKENLVELVGVYVFPSAAQRGQFETERLIMV